jgi:hypothetical protein
MNNQTPHASRKAHGEAKSRRFQIEKGGPPPPPPARSSKSETSVPNKPTKVMPAPANAARVGAADVRYSGMVHFVVTKNAGCRAPVSGGPLFLKRWVHSNRRAAGSSVICEKFLTARRQLINLSVN